jgi:hypothetical protein
VSSSDVPHMLQRVGRVARVWVIAQVLVLQVHWMGAQDPGCSVDHPECRSKARLECTCVLGFSCCGVASF